MLSLLQVEDLFLLFAKKASAFNSWFENAEEDLTDPVRCNSVEEIRVRTGHWSFLLLTKIKQPTRSEPKTIRK